VSTTPSPFLEVQGVSKHFPGVQALDKVSMRLGRGEVLALIGENGAGKSTLMKVLAGVYQPDGGSILLEGAPVHFADVAAALARGIALIHQELNLAENLSVAANLFLGRDPRWGGPLGLIARARTHRDARTALDRVGLSCPVDMIVADLAPGQKQLVEIARALSMNARVLIMDEPTSSLTQSETDRLYEVIDELKRADVAVVYISHRLAEVKRVAHRVVVLRDGKNAGELAGSEIAHDAMVRLMVGRELREFFHRQHRPEAAPVFVPGEYEIPLTPSQPPAPKPVAPPRLEVRDLCYAGGSANAVSFVVRRGEIVGMAGLVGAGRTELAEAIFGIRKIVAGQVLLDGVPVTISHPDEAVASGVALVPEDRRLHGLVLEESVQRNISLPNMDRLSVGRLVLSWRERMLSRSMCDKLNVRTPSLAQTVGLLSGGNQQKVVLAKWLARRPHVLIFDEPTRGIDVGAKSEIYALMDELVGEGVGILMISSDLEEILGMSDRVLVLHEGRLAGELKRDQLSEEAVMRLATGGQAGVGLTSRPR
jgi:ribose transport system ATP-binding protein